MNEYLAKGFTNVDLADNIEAYSSCLTLLDNLPYFKKYKQHTYDLLELNSGDWILDAGCGLGDDVFRIADVIKKGRVIGVDASSKLIKIAKSNKKNSELPTEFHVGDIKALQYKDSFFSRCRIDRVLQHIPEPQLAISELVRILKPGGILVAYDNDWGAFSVTSSNKLITRTIENLWCDSFTNSWAGRELQEFFVKSGLSSIRSFPSTSVITDYETADRVYNLEQTVQRAIELGHITKDDGSKWIDELRHRNKSGYFSTALTAYTVVGRKSC